MKNKYISTESSSKRGENEEKQTLNNEYYLHIYNIYTYFTIFTYIKMVTLKWIMIILHRYKIKVFEIRVLNYHNNAYKLEAKRWEREETEIFQCLL